DAAAGIVAVAGGAVEGEGVESGDLDGPDAVGVGVAGDAGNGDVLPRDEEVVGGNGGDLNRADADAADAGDIGDGAGVLELQGGAAGDGVAVGLAREQDGGGDVDAGAEEVGGGRLEERHVLADQGAGEGDDEGLAVEGIGDDGDGAIAA